MSTENKTNTQNPKTDAAGAAAHNPFAQFAQFGPFGSMDPMQMWTQAQQVWTQAQQTWMKAFTDGYGSAQKWADEYAQIEKQLFGRANQAVDTWAQLAHDTIAYSEQLSAQARKMAFEAARKATVAGA